MRASDADREKTVDVLRAAVGDGRLNLEEYEDRITRAYGARTFGDLAPLTADLQPGQPMPAGVLSQASGPISATLGSAKRTGRWVVPERLEVSAVLGEVKLDLREAVLQSRVVTLSVRIILGSVELIVPEGVHVTLNGPMIAGSRESKMRTLAGPGAPVIDIDGTIFMGSLTVKPPRRTWRERWEQ